MQLAHFLIAGWGKLQNEAFLLLDVVAGDHIPPMGGLLLGDAVVVPIEMSQK